ERSAAERPEVGLARQAVAVAQEGSQAARGEFLPKIFVRAAVGRTDGKNVISLQVNLAYRGAVAASERIDLSRTAVVQAEENLRLIRVRYRNGNATPTDIVDSEAAL